METTLAPSGSRSRKYAVPWGCVPGQPPQLDGLAGISRRWKPERRLTLRMGNVYFVSFSQLREGAETRINHCNCFRRGGRSPVLGVGCDDVEKRHLFHFVIVGYEG